jgi:5-methyltetrahydrofolate--homocysteine methyltransferase
MDYILDQAVQQVDAGADLLDVNVGMPGIDEKGMMIRTVKALQSIGSTPLQLDSTIPAVMEAALRVYNGKPIVNSVNGEEASLQNILPLVKKYGAAVVGLTLDENGIPKKAEERFAIAKKILDRATALGIPKRDVYIDCLTLTASAEQDGARETLKAVRMVKEQLGLKTVLGVSNISFGLPNREAVTRTFLTMALENGLDLPIINPNIACMTEAVRAYRLLDGIDRNCTAFVEAYANMPTATTVATAPSGGKPQGEKKPETVDLPYAMSHGLKNEGAKLTAQLLETTDPMEVVNGILIPALDESGKLFEQGKIFLPQLIQTAGVAQAAFEVIKTTLIQRNAAPVSRGEIVLATVKGDIHDIGKNIVKVLLENYGYTVLDLGRDVPCQLVADTAKEHEVKLVGLSALMTTTLGAMEETIQLVKAACPDCKVVVGGAVLTPDYAEKIGADFYAKDAMETVGVAKQIIG